MDRGKACQRGQKDVRGTVSCLSEDIYSLDGGKVDQWDDEEGRNGATMRDGECGGMILRLKIIIVFNEMC